MEVEDDTFVNHEAHFFSIDDSADFLKGKVEDGSLYDILYTFELILGGERSLLDEETERILREGI